MLPLLRVRTFGGRRRLCPERLAASIQKGFTPLRLLAIVRGYRSAFRRYCRANYTTSAGSRKTGEVAPVGRLASRDCHALDRPKSRMVKTVLSNYPLARRKPVVEILGVTKPGDRMATSSHDRVATPERLSAIELPSRTPPKYRTAAA